MKNCLLVLFLLISQVSHGDLDSVMDRRAFLRGGGAGALYLLVGVQFFESFFSGSFEEVMGRLKSEKWLNRVRTQIDAAQSFEEYEQVRRLIHRFYSRYRHLFSRSDIELLNQIDMYMNERLSAQIYRSGLNHPQQQRAETEAEIEEKSSRMAQGEEGLAMRCLSFL